VLYVNNYNDTALVKLPYRTGLYHINCFNKSLAPYHNVTMSSCRKPAATHTQWGCSAAACQSRQSVDVSALCWHISTAPTSRSSVRGPHHTRLYQRLHEHKTTPTNLHCDTGRKWCTVPEKKPSSNYLLPNRQTNCSESKIGSDKVENMATK